MKIFAKIISTALLSALLLTSCAGNDAYAPAGKPENGGKDPTDMGGDGTLFGEKLDDLGVYDGDISGESYDVEVKCVSGTSGCYTFENGTLTFTALGEDSVYSVCGTLTGNIVIDVGDDHKLDLELCGLSLSSASITPVTVKTGNKVSITAKKDTENFIYDKREAITDGALTQYSGAIHSEVDLEICGKGALSIVSENNDGIRSKDDIEVKNLTLTVVCTDNALRGNDSVTVESGALTLISTKGDCIKTENTDISSKGNQRGSVTVSGGSVTLYSACDGIDAAYDAIISGENTVLNVYTDKYSTYSEKVTAVSEELYFIRFTSKAYSYSVKYYNSDSDVCWVNAEYHSSVSGGRTTYHYYSFPKKPEYSKMMLFVYESGTPQEQDSEYKLATEYLTPSASYDTFAISHQGSSYRYSWTNYTTSVQGGGPGGFGGMQEGNSDKGDYSTKGIKAGNAITVSCGTVNIKSYDDAIHANADTDLENGASPTGNVTVSGGLLTLYSNDDGIHADGALVLNGGSVYVVNSYEGLEGQSVKILDGQLSVTSKDDGINATATSGNAIEISGGTLYVYASGDGIDSNSRTSYDGILFSGGRTVVISTSNGNSAIDTESGYSYSGGYVLAIMPSGGMSSEATHCSGFSSIGTTKSLSITAGSLITVKTDGESTVTVKLPKAMSCKAIFLGSDSASVASAETNATELDANGVYWYK